MRNLQNVVVVLLSVLLIGSGCATKPSGPKKIVTVESREPVLVKDVHGRVSVRVSEDSTVVEIDSRRFVCQDYRGYIGQMGSINGWLKVGRLDFSYDSQKISIRGKKRWTTFDRLGEQNYFAKQDGTVGRSVFKD